MATNQLSSQMLNDLTSISHQEIIDEIPDLMTYANPIWKYFMEEYNVDDPGGPFIQLPINIGENPNIGFIAGDGSQLINLNPYQSMLPGTIVRKYFVAPLSVTLDDMAVTNDSKNAITSMLAAKIEQTKDTLVRTLTQAVHGSAASNVNQFNGLLDIFANAGTAYAGLLNTTIDSQYGLDAKGKSKWLPEINTTTQAPTFTNISPMIHTIKGKSQQVGSKTKYSKYLMFSNSAVYSAFINNEQLKQRFTDSKLMEDGFEAVKILGIDYAIDEFTPGSGIGYSDNYLYILTAPSIKMYIRYGLGKKKSPLDGENMQIPNNALVSQRSFVVANMGCNNRRVNGVFKNIQC